MFPASNPVLATTWCREGMVGCFPALNARTTDGLVQWLYEMQANLTDRDAPYGADLIVHKSNPRFEPDLAQGLKYKVPLVITSLGTALVFAPASLRPCAVYRTSTLAALRVYCRWTNNSAAHSVLQSSHRSIRWAQSRTVSSLASRLLLWSRPPLRWWRL